MLELSKEELVLVEEILVRARDHSKTKDFNLEKIMVDSLGSSDMKNYDLLLRKIAEEMKNMGMTDRNNPAKKDV
ncbi:MAG: hypothetical protein FWF38_02600 [Spirochaetaceae bacterium]|nr:hypothetical protein [Spirochaetaceae bacterium]